MPDREHQRVPCAARVQYRSASAFLIAYATNLSRGGLFIEGAPTLASGTELILTLEVPELGTFEIPARVAWLRSDADPGGPAGMGVEFGELRGPVGAVIDELVSSFEGIQVALLSRDGRSSQSVGRAIRSAIATADVVEISDAGLLSAVADDCELVVIDADAERDGGDLAIATVAALTRPLPAIVLSAVPERRERAERAGAFALSSPPQAGELGKAAVRALGRPLAITVVEKPSP